MADLGPTEEIISLIVGMGMPMDPPGGAGVCGQEWRSLG